MQGGVMVRLLAYFIISVCCMPGIAISADVKLDAKPYKIRQAWVSYTSSRDNLEIPALFVAPTEKGRYPALLYIHGRWGLSDMIIQQLHAIAQRGVVVMAPDYYFARAIPALPAFNDSDVSYDLESAVPFFKSVLKEATLLDSEKIGILGEDHGGYYALLIAAHRPNEIGAVIGQNPLVQDPNAAKPKQLYQYLSEVDQIKSPTLFLIGGNERQMRRLGVNRVVARLKELKQTVSYIEYPGAQRCFEWRTDSSHLPDQMARIDSLNQLVKFMGLHVGGEGLLVLGQDGLVVYAGKNGSGIN